MRERAKPGARDISAGEAVFAGGCQEKAKPASERGKKSAQFAKELKCQRKMSRFEIYALAEAAEF